MGNRKAVIAGVIICAAGVSILVAPGHGQGSRSKDIGKTPREVLSPQEIQELTNHTPVPVAPLVEGLTQKLDYMTGQQRVILEQLQIVLEVRKQVEVNTERMTDMERRMGQFEVGFSEHIKSTGTEPASIESLRARMDDRDAEAKWFFGILAGLLISGFGVLFRKFGSGQIMTLRWFKEDSAAKHEEHVALKNTVEETRDLTKETKHAAAEAVRAANDVNLKILASGVRTTHLEQKEHLREQREEDAKDI